MDTLELAPVLSKLEEDMRAALRKHSQMHVKEKTVLLRAIGKVRAVHSEPSLGSVNDMM